MNKKDETLDLLNGLVNLLNEKHQQEALKLVYNGDMLLNGFDLHVLVGDDGKKRLVMETMYGYSFTVALVGFNYHPPLVLLQSTDLTEYFLMLLNDLSTVQLALLKKLGYYLSRGVLSEEMIMPRSLPSWPSKGVAKAYECLRAIRGVRNDPERVGQAVDTAVLALEQLERGVFDDVPGDAGLQYHVPQWALDLLVATDDLARHLEWAKDKDDETKCIIAKLKDIADEAYKAQVLDMPELHESPHYLYNKMMPYAPLCKLASAQLPHWFVITVDSGGELWANGIKTEVSDIDFVTQGWVVDQKFVGRVSDYGLEYSHTPNGGRYFAEWETWQIRRSDWDLYQIKAGSFGDEKAVNPMLSPSESALTDKPIAIIDRMNAIQEAVDELGRDLHEASDAVERMILGIDNTAVVVLTDLVATYDEFKSASFGDSLGNEHWDGRFSPIVERARELLVSDRDIEQRTTAVEDYPTDAHIKELDAELTRLTDELKARLIKRFGEQGLDVNIVVDTGDASEIPTITLDEMVDESGLPIIYDELDPKIAPVVSLLREHGFPTISSCDGGDGHAMDMPTVIIRNKDVGDSAVGIMGYTYAIWELLDRFGYYGFEVFPRVSEGGVVEYYNVVFFYNGEDGRVMPRRSLQDTAVRESSSEDDYRPDYWRAILWARYQARVRGYLAPYEYVEYMPSLLRIALQCSAQGYFDEGDANERLEGLIFG